MKHPPETMNKYDLGEALKLIFPPLWLPSGKLT